jgi:hypothetical protein
MTADKINIIAENIPDGFTSKKLSPPAVVIGDSKRVWFPVDKELGSFIHAYKNPAFGWHSAAIFAAADKEIPIALTGEDNWVFKAYLYCLNQKYRDKNVLEAISLASPEMKNIRNIIEALLVCKDYEDTEKIGHVMSISPKTISAYEKLFFNVLDRRNDYSYIKNLVYPETRMVEFYDGYAKREDVSTLLKRFGYNHSGDELLFLSGLPEHKLAEVPAAVASGRLESVLMTQGHLLTKIGFSNQTQNTQAIYHARSVMAATKQGGQTNTQDVPMSSVSELLSHTFTDFARKDALNRIEKKRKSKEVIEV